MHTICSFAFLAGPVTFARSLLTPERLPFTAIYIGSLVATLYTSLVVRSKRTACRPRPTALTPRQRAHARPQIQSYLLILLCIFAQMAALAWYAPPPAAAHMGTQLALTHPTVVFFPLQVPGKLLPRRRERALVRRVDVRPRLAVPAPDLRCGKTLP